MIGIKREIKQIYHLVNSITNATKLGDDDEYEKILEELETFRQNSSAYLGFKTEEYITELEHYANLLKGNDDLKKRVYEKLEYFKGLINKDKNGSSYYSDLEHEFEELDLFIKLLNDVENESSESLDDDFPYIEFNEGDEKYVIFDELNKEKVKKKMKTLLAKFRIRDNKAVLSPHLLEAIFIHAFMHSAAQLVL